MAAVAVAATSASNANLTFAAKVGLAAPLIPAAVAWILAEISGGNGAHPHDIKLFERILATVSDDERQFVRSHDFANNFELSSLVGVREISYWQGSAYAFLDHGLQRKWTALNKEIVAVRDLIAKTTAPVKGNVGMQTVYPTSVDPEDPPLRVIEEIKALNDAATAVTISFDRFEPYARRKLVI